MSEPRGLTRRQVLRLLQAIDPSHVESKRGLSYISQHQARAELTRIFGPTNWNSEVVEMALVFERTIEPGDYQYPKSGDNKKPYFIACYRAGVRLTIRDYWGNELCSFVEYHAEENAPLPNRGEAHAMAMTSVESYAFRRAAIGLGDRLGLGLYDNGSKAPLVKGSLMLDDPDSPLGQPEAPKPQEPAGAPEEAPPVPMPQSAVSSPESGARRLQQALHVDQQTGETQ